jgi:hypothetical protein
MLVGLSSIRDRLTQSDLVPGRDDGVMLFVGDNVAVKQFDMTVHARRKADLLYRKADVPWAASAQRLDDAGKLVEHLADLTFTHDQRRTERERVADGAEHDIVFEET